MSDLLEDLSLLGWALLAVMMIYAIVGPPRGS